MKGVNTPLCATITQIVDARLAVVTNDQSSVNHSYSFLEEQNGRGLLFLLRYPSGLLLDSKTYYELYDIIAPAVSSVKTMIRPLTFQLVHIDDMPMEMAQGFFFPWRNGRPKRLVGNINQILDSYDVNQRIPIMDGMSFNAKKVRSILLTGSTGSGKTEGFKYFVQAFSRMTNTSRTKLAHLIIIDSKKGAGTRWAKSHDHNIEILVPDKNDRPEDFIPKVNARLADVIRVMNDRQDDLYQHADLDLNDASDLDYPPIWIMFEEFEGLTLGMSARNTQVGQLYRILTQIALMGRESLIGLCITSQIARNDVIPIPIRQEMLIRILLGVIDSGSTAYLFGDLNYNIPLPLGGVGSGIISINDGEHYGIEPVKMPTIINKDKGEN